MRIVAVIAVVETVDGLFFETGDLLGGLGLEIGDFSLGCLLLNGQPRVLGASFNHMETARVILGHVDLVNSTVTNELTGGSGAGRGGSLALERNNNNNNKKKFETSDRSWIEVGGGFGATTGRFGRGVATCGFSGRRRRRRCVSATAAQASTQPNNFDATRLYSMIRSIVSN